MKMLKTVTIVFLVLFCSVQANSAELLHTIHKNISTGAHFVLITEVHPERHAAAHEANKVLTRNGFSYIMSLSNITSENMDVQLEGFRPWIAYHIEIFSEEVVKKAQSRMLVAKCEEDSITAQTSIADAHFYIDNCDFVTPSMSGEELAYAPYSPKVAENLVNSFFLVKDDSSAIKVIDTLFSQRAAIGIEIDDAKLTLQKANAYFNLGDYEKASNFAEKAVKVSENKVISDLSKELIAQIAKAKAQ